MMDFPLVIPVIIRRAEALFRHKTIATRRPDRSIARTTYAEMLDRTRRLAVALRTIGIRPGDRVATLAWASQAHLLLSIWRTSGRTSKTVWMALSPRTLREFRSNGSRNWAIRRRGLSRSQKNKAWV